MAGFYAARSWIIPPLPWLDLQAPLPMDSEGPVLTGFKINAGRIKGTKGCVMAITRGLKPAL